jgi:hypothetical protein
LFGSYVTKNSARSQLLREQQFTPSKLATVACYELSVELPRMHLSQAPDVAGEIWLVAAHSFEELRNNAHWQTERRNDSTSLSS